MAIIKNPITVVQGGSPTPPTPVEEKDINFYDYDGTLVESWTLAELPNKTALPSNPTHTGLTAQGWNWTLADLQNENAKMDVGQTYIPTDGKTHLFVDVDADHLSVALGVAVKGSATVDWGDGSATDTMSGSSLTTGQSAYHTYAAAGSYEVTLDVPDGNEANVRGGSHISFFWRHPNYATTRTAEMAAVAEQPREIWIGKNIRIGYNAGYAFSYLMNLEKITVPLEAAAWVEARAFQGCLHLRCFVFPSGVSETSNFWSSFFYQCQKLAVVSLTNDITRLGMNMFANSSVQKLRIPSSVATLGIAPFQNCLLADIKIPPSVTDLGGSIFDGCFQIVSVDFSDFTSIPTITGNTFNNIATTGFIIKVPSALEATWKTTGDWTNYAQYIVGV